MERAWPIIRAVLTLVAMLALVGWVMWRALRKSDDPAYLLLKWIATVVILVVARFAIKPLMVHDDDPLSKVLGVGMGAGFGFALAALWRRHIAEIVAKPFGSLYDGGDVPPEPQPFYSIAQAKRKRGRFQEAIYEIQKQLTKFPQDVTGQMLVAEIQAENLNDLAGAQLTIERFCHQPDHAPRNIAYALNTLADWHMKFAQDTGGARQALEKIIELLPGSEEAQVAAQRIAHLASTGELLAAHDRAPLRVREGVKDIGLLMDSSGLQKAEKDPATQATEFVEHLERHPLDSDVREKLAVIYAEHYQRLDLATDQLEQLIQQPNQPAKQVVHWLNLLADFQIKHAAGYELAKRTLERVIDLDPNLAAAENARQRIAHLKLELKKNEKIQTIKLGTYEKDIGLKRSSS